jgi:hypothetical protein
LLNFFKKGVHVAVNARKSETSTRFDFRRIENLIVPDPTPDEEIDGVKGR